MLPSRKLTYAPKMAYLKMIFLFPRWDMLIPWRVPFLSDMLFFSLAEHFSGATAGWCLQSISASKPWSVRASVDVQRIQKTILYSNPFLHQPLFIFFLYTMQICKIWFDMIWYVYRCILPPTITVNNDRSEKRQNMILGEGPAGLIPAKHAGWRWLEWFEWEGSSLYPRAAAR